MSRARERAVEADLSAVERADEEVAVPHVRKRPLDVERRAGERIEHGAVREIGRVTRPMSEHGAAMFGGGGAVPIGRVTVKAERELFPHERGVPAGRGLRWVEDG